MKYTITLTEAFAAQDIRQLLENDWLVPRKVRHFLRINQHVLLNGEPALFHETVKAGDEITLIFADSDYPQPQHLLGQADLLTILYEDEHLIILNKPAGMKTHPNQPTEDDTLLNHLAAYLAPQGLFPYVVHRLDKETSGAIVFAKNPFILPLLGKQLEAKKIQRTYQALAQGRIQAEQFTVSKNIGRDRHDPRKRIATERGGQPAVTHFTVQERSPRETKLTCLLETGRTHQIRVHLADYGHPVMGDPLYQKRPSGSRLMLHAYKLALSHPLTGAAIDVTASPSLWN